MEIEKVIATLEEYYKELSGILGRFTKSSSEIHIDPQDGYRMREIATELVDFINDHIPNSKHYVVSIANYYNQGINNWLNSSSYASVEEIRGAVKSIKVRIERNPFLFESVTGKIAIDSGEQMKFNGIDTIANRFPGRSTGYPALPPQSRT